MQWIDLFFIMYHPFSAIVRVLQPGRDRPGVYRAARKLVPGHYFGYLRDHVASFQIEDATMVFLPTESHRTKRADGKRMASGIPGYIVVYIANRFSPERRTPKWLLQRVLPLHNLCNTNLCKTQTGRF